MAEMARMVRAYALLALLGAPAGFADEVSCLKVVDGDSLVLQMPYGEQEVRLEGIDAPELSQRYGPEAHQYLAEMVLGRRVESETVGADNYGRLLVRIHVGEVSVNREMVRMGLAWHFKRYSTDEILAAAEDFARSKGVGLWSEPRPVPPWEFRHGAGTAAPVRLQGDTATTIHGNRSSGVYHLPGCRNYDCKNCVMEFDSAPEARAAGFRPAGCCAARRTSGNDR